MAVNLQMVEQLNRKSTQLNAQRQQQIGKREATRNAYDRAILAYKQKYGVSIDDTNLQSECNAVQKQLEDDYNTLNQAILNIESGQYKIEQQQAREKQRQEQLARQQEEEKAIADAKARELAMQTPITSQVQVQQVGAELPKSDGETAPRTVAITPDMLNIQANPTKPLVELPDDGDEDTSNVGVSFGGTSTPNTQTELKPTIRPNNTNSGVGTVTFGTPTQPQSVEAPKKEGFTYDSNIAEEEETIQVSGWGKNSNGGKVDINSQFSGLFGGK